MDPFGQTEKGGRRGDAKIGHFFMDVINVWSLMVVSASSYEVKATLWRVHAL